MPHLMSPEFEKTQLEHALKIAQETRSLKRAAEFLESVGVLTFGIEHVSCADSSLDYVNRGETYSDTIAQDGETFLLTSWGSWYETVENEHCADDGVIRCGWCSEFTPVAENWRETICEHCAHNVAGS